MSVITTATSRRVMHLVSVLQQMKIYRSTNLKVLIATHEVSVMINNNICIYYVSLR